MAVIAYRVLNLLLSIRVEQEVLDVLTSRIIIIGNGTNQSVAARTSLKCPW